MPLAPKSVTGGQALRLALLGGTYVRWLGLFLAIGVAVSAMAGRTGRAMLVLAGTDLAHPATLPSLPRRIGGWR